ncbi:hypothetical protein L1987_05761 [Smallanthus sonchifolius]|uniref:Uncharacterized protein n=1 Tax=Smallanthus sonchifolius TaxID=185202 RepID=A0ACB9JWD9_9ASTR|nr:hypothetical protein L1987_05761 [Smallanthus sonchifolius]
MSPAGTAIFINPLPIFNQFLKFDIHRKNPFCSPAFRTLNFKESEMVHRNSVRLNNAMAAGPVGSGVASADADGDERLSPAVSALEHEALIDNDGVSFHQTPGGLHALVNNLSRWIIGITYNGLILLRHDAFTFWAATGCLLNFILSLTLKRFLKQERPVCGLRSDPGMPSTHAQSIFYTTVFIILSLIKWQGLNGATAILSALVATLGSYFSWLRVLQRYHTTSQMVVGAVVGFIFSVLWFWAWEEIVYKTYYSSFWLQILLVVGVACFSLGFVFSVWKSIKGNNCVMFFYVKKVEVKNVSRLCHAKPIVTVNGMFPGPTVYAREDDRVLINSNGIWRHRHLPKQWTPFPFPRPDAEHVIVFGEGWHADVEEVVKQGNALGLPPNMSDAHTINGKPGPLFPCSEKHTFAMEVEQGKKYMLRIVNAALNDELFFAIAGHNMTVVEIDEVYTKPFMTNALLIAPGQTMNVLVSANQAPGRYFMAVRPFQDVSIPIDNKTATAILQYKNVPTTVIPTLPHLPLPNDTEFALSYNKKLRSLNTPSFLANVPLKVDRHLFFTIGIGKSVSDFPDNPPTAFNYTGAPLTANLFTAKGTRLSKISFNSTVELVIQDTNLLSVESHPFHLHGFNFFVVGTGVGNFDPAKDPTKYNLVDPPERNTVGVPTGGWTVIRFRADNPGDVNGIRVGSGTNIQDNALVHVAKSNISGNVLSTTLGNNVTVGHGAVLHGCTVEDEAFIGMGATLLDGAYVEKNAMVAAGALVRQNTRVPFGEVWGGNPAKFMRKLTEEEIAFISQSATNYTNLAMVHAAENNKSFEEIELEKTLRKKFARKDEEYDSMIGVVRETPVELTLPDNILPDKAQKDVLNR